MRSVLVFLLFLSSLISISAVNAQQINTANYTVQQANLTITNATIYLNKINQSTYLIFSPNLTQAYSYLNKSQQLYKTSPSLAVFYANQAVSSASSAYSKINSYKSISLIFMLVLTFCLGIALRNFMSPIKSRKKR